MWNKIRQVFRHIPGQTFRRSSPRFFENNSGSSTFWVNLVGTAATIATAIVGICSIIFLGFQLSIQVDQERRQLSAYLTGDGSDLYLAKPDSNNFNTVWNIHKYVKNTGSTPARRLSAINWCGDTNSDLAHALWTGGEQFQRGDVGGGGSRLVAATCQYSTKKIDEIIKMRDKIVIRTDIFYEDVFDEPKELQICSEIELSGSALGHVEFSDNLCSGWVDCADDECKGRRLGFPRQY